MAVVFSVLLLFVGSDDLFGIFHGRSLGSNITEAGGLGVQPQESH